MDWFKVFGLSFFNNKLAARSAKYGFVSVVLAIALSFLFFMFGFMAADVVPFSTHYGNAGQYREFVHNALSDLEIEVKDGIAKSDKIVNTRTSEADRQKYVLNGYDFIIDTRASDMLIEFSQIAVRGDKKISYEEYLKLSNKSDYKLEFVYTDNELQLTAEDTAKQESFLNGLSNEEADGYNKKAAEEFKKLKESNLSGEEYAKEIYFLYVRYYYTNFESALMSAKAPVLCDYYYLNFILGDNDDYFYLLDDICVGSFKTDNGIPAVFAGFYTDCPHGVLDENSVDGFIKDVFYNSVSYSMSSYFTSAMQMAPGYILIPVLIGLILYLISKSKKDAPKFLECYKTVNSFAWVSALATGLLTFILGFFVFARKLYLFMPLIFALILILRTAVFYFMQRVEDKATEQDEID